MKAAQKCFRRTGFIAATVDDICREAGVSKGAFFHHFAGKEALAMACLEKWDADMAAMDAGAAYRSLPDTGQRLLGCMNLFIELLSGGAGPRSCLAGTIAQETFESHPQLRDASQACFAGAIARFAVLVGDAAASNAREVEADSLATLWAGAIQGALILCKASGDVSVIRSNLNHVKSYIADAVGIGAVEAASSSKHRRKND